MVRTSKKRGGSRRRGHHGSNDDEEPVPDEFTALSAIYEEDCKFVSGWSSPPQIVIKLRPYSKYVGYEETDISAMLSVRCLPGYPYKCPKLQITPGQGLTTADAEKLLSLLEDQANSNAREGRVMIFNLVEAARKFLSESHDEDSESEPLGSRSSDFGEPNASLPSSRYLKDFEELKRLGRGGFGSVWLCKHKLDGRQYAVKVIRKRNKEILREVATLSSLQHQHVVRYYQAWFETGVADPSAGANWGSNTAGSTVSTESSEQDSTYLYIQMEYCPRTLRQVLDSCTQFDKDFAWHSICQITEGLAHIHGQGIIHRDLTPNNIFLDAGNDIKIGDFGLAKFLKLEQLEQDVGFSKGVAGNEIDSTSEAGTHFYTAPEIRQGSPEIDEKADMYSLGVVFFELWHPFGTGMERHITLTNLKEKGELPVEWENKFPEHASLLLRLISPVPSNRPSARELLQHAFPQLLDKEAGFVALEEKLEEKEEELLSARISLLKMYPTLPGDAITIGQNLDRNKFIAAAFLNMNSESETETLYQLWQDRISGLAANASEGELIPIQEYEKGELKALRESYGENLYWMIREAFRELRVTVRMGFPNKPLATLTEILTQIAKLSNTSSVNENELERKT